METRRHTDVIRDWLSPAGKQVLDIGCGDGALTRALARMGAHAAGIEVNAAALAKARAEPRVADETFVEAGGERLPFADGSVDAVVYLNALHHVPVASMAAAIAEAARVLRKGGAFLVIEPLAQGEYYLGLTRRIDDESDVREAAYRILCDAPADRLKPVREERYLTTLKYADFDAFTERMRAVDPARIPAVERLRDVLRREFDRVGRKQDDGVCFDQPCRANLLSRL